MRALLVACEYSGRVRNAFVEKGVDAMSCDILPEEQPRPDGWNGHYEGDVRRLFQEMDDNALQWPIFSMIAHPPCTFLTNAGVRWLYYEGHSSHGLDKHRMMEMEDACDFFNIFVDNYRFRHVCVENPIQHKYARERIRKHDQIIQPWMFGDYETKATCLWLKGLPKLVPVYKTAEECREALGFPAGTKPHAKVHLMAPGPDRGKERSRTPLGIAKAMAEQWSGL